MDEREIANWLRKKADTYIARAASINSGAGWGGSGAMGAWLHKADVLRATANIIYPECLSEPETMTKG